MICKPGGKDAVLDASILVARGYAQIALNDGCRARSFFADCRESRAERGGAVAGGRRLAFAR